MYTLIFGSVPDGRTMNEQPSSSSKYSTFEPEMGVLSILPRPMTYTEPS